MADVQLLASQRLSDSPDGGGLITSKVIVDNVVNNVWPDVSRVDRTFGAVNLRKIGVKATTPDNAIFSGLHIMCLFPPQDPRVSVTLFSTNSWSDERADAQSAMERYLDESVPTRMIPFDRQLLGQRTILVFQRPELDLPNIGEVYRISNLPNEDVSQFFRVMNIDQSVQTFTDADTNQDFQARVITMTINEPLKTTYIGSQPNKHFTALPNSSMIRKTIVSDAVNYHTVHSLAEDAAIGDLTVKLDSVYTQLVPATTSESPIILNSPAQSLSIVDSSSAVKTSPLLQPGTDYNPADGATIYVPTAISPGSLTLEYQTGGATQYDDGAGNLRQASLTGTIIGSIDYAAGSVTYSGHNPGTGNALYIHWIPAAAVGLLSQTLNVPITQSTRGYIYVETLRPIPTPGNLQVSYRALGKWYTLTDDGSGALTGDIGVGTGLLNFATGGVSLSLGALPDIGSSIILSWGGDSQFEIRTGDVTIDKPVVNGTLPLGNCKPSTFSVSWTAGGVSKTATDDGSGNITGDATGHIVYGNGTYSLKPALLYDPTTNFSVTYQASPIHTELFNPSRSGSTITITAAHAPIRAKSILINYEVTASGNGFLPETGIITLTDNGAGQLVTPSNAVVGTVNYTTGAMTWDPDYLLGIPTLSYESFEQNVPQRTVDSTTGFFSPNNLSWAFITAVINNNMTVAFTNGTNVTLQYKEDSATDTSHSDTLTAPPLTVDLTPTVSNSIVPGGILFTLGGRVYTDRAASLYYGMSAITDAGALGGSVDYATGVATITSWVGGASATITLNALLTQVGALPIMLVSGRAPGSPLRPGSFYMQANQIDGTLISATADVNGKIDTTTMHGYVDVTTGVFQVAFGRYVLDSSLTSGDKAESWYNSANVGTDGYIFRPNPVIGTSIKYNCVVQTSLPLDSTILGLDPVRLPSDGRVQAVRPANMIIFHDTAVETLPSGLTAGQTITLTRGELALIEVRDQNGLFVGSVSPGVTTGTYFTADLATGIITMATPLDLSAFTQPLKATHRIEDSCLVTDVQITGHVSISEPLTHAYTAANSHASTALIAPFVGGSVQAKYTHLFSQETWNSSAPNWTDAIIGGGTTPQFDDLDYPIITLNRDAITEKWALVFTSPTIFQIVAKDLGVIGTGNTSSDVFPINPGTSGGLALTSATFTIAAEGSTQSVSVVSADNMEQYDRVVCNDGTHSFIGTITLISGTTLTIRTDNITAGLAGDTMATAASILVQNPYFFIDHRGFGSGWATGNAIRFDTEGAGMPIWLARTIKSGPASYTDDRDVIEPRWDKS